MTVSKMEHPRVGLGYWFLWIIASGVGWSVGFALNIFFLSNPNIARLIRGIYDNLTIFGLVFGILPGLLMGLCQWLVLQRASSITSWWIPATTLGSSIGWSLTGVVCGSANCPENGSVTGAIFGLCLGFTQWLVLQYQIPRVSWWIVLASISGWAVGNMLDSVLSGAIAGAITGLALIWFLNQAGSISSS